jgi:hypothetical protein
VQHSSEEREHWNDIVSAAETRVRNCFSSTFFQRRNISIPDQQSRCFNLCYALSKSGRIKSQQSRRDRWCGCVGYDRGGRPRDGYGVPCLRL